MVDRKADLLETIGRERALAAKIRAVAEGRDEVTFTNLIEHAQPTL